MPSAILGHCHALITSGEHAATAHKANETRAASCRMKACTWGSGMNPPKVREKLCFARAVTRRPDTAHGSRVDSALLGGARLQRRRFALLPRERERGLAN